MTGDLARLTAARFAALAIGGILLPLACFLAAPPIGVAAASFAFLVVGELLERTLFFAAASSPGMPGGLE
jgi:DMSO reductase anchor subunit